VTQLRWLLTAAIAAYACQLAVHHATPIDRALPFVAVLVTVVAWRSYPSLMLAVPLLLVAEIAIADEGLRLLTFGAIAAVVWSAGAGWLGGVPRRRLPERERDAPEPDAGMAALLALAAILLLRWIPFSDVQLGRELFLLAIAALIVLVLDRTPFAVAVAVVVVLITPAIPLRTLLLPIAVFAIAVLAKILGMPAIKLTWPSTIAIAFVMLFFPWSGVVARAFPYFLQRPRPMVLREKVTQALSANTSVTLDVPRGAKTLIVSGANVARMKRGMPIGRIDPGGRVLRIGDAADWGALRRDQFYEMRNPLPRNAAGLLRDYGYSAWVDGAGRVALPPHARTIVVTADAALPKGASLQVEGFE
jgi:hypothetical protein